MASTTLPELMVLSSYYQTTNGNAYYDTNGSILLGEQDVFSTLVKIAVEPATSDSRYVNLRFVYSNKYWARNANDSFVVAASTEPEEDTTKSSCTLFQAVEVDATNRVFYLVHVQSGGRVRMNGPTTAFFVDEDPGEKDGYLIYVDWESLVKMPTHVAFKGDNGMYLKATIFNDASVLQFSSSDADEIASGHKVSQMSDGRIQITSDLYGEMWWSAQPWVFGDYSAQWDSDSTIFTPVKVDDSTIALRSNGSYSSSNFCSRLSANYRTDCLSAAVPTITTEARLVVQELLLSRTISDAIYLMDNARIYNLTPFVAGKTQVTNDTDEEASMDVEITYQVDTSYTFSRSTSLSGGVTTTFKVGVPLIESTEIQISFNIDETLDWDTTTTTTASVTASGSIPVPAKTTATIAYVGTTGTCDVPYSYTQIDVSSTDGTISRIPQVDGIYTGINSYDFSFQISSTQPIA